LLIHWRDNPMKINDPVTNYFIFKEIRSQYVCKVTCTCSNLSTLFLTSGFVTKLTLLWEILVNFKCKAPQRHIVGTWALLLSSPNGRQKYLGDEILCKMQVRLLSVEIKLTKINIYYSLTALYFCELLLNFC